MFFRRLNKSSSHFQVSDEPFRREEDDDYNNRWFKLGGGATIDVKKLKQSSCPAVNIPFSDSAESFFDWTLLYRSFWHLLRG